MCQFFVEITNNVSILVKRTNNVSILVEKKLIMCHINFSEKN